MAIATMISGFGPSNTDVDLQIRSYHIAADGCREDAVRLASRRFIQGDVSGHKSGYLPTVAEFAKECRAAVAELDARDWAKSRKALPPPTSQEASVNTPEHRAKMYGLITKWKRAMAGDRQAQEELRPWGWKQ